MKRYLTGGAVILAGILVLLSNLDVPGVRAFLSVWWPLGFVVAGLLVYINDKKSYLWALILAALGTILLLNRLGVANVNPFTFFWPAVIIALGISLITGSRRRHSPDGSDSTVTAILSGVNQRSGAEEYRGGRATALLGGIQLDLRKAKIKDGATLNVFAFWGGVDILVPEDVIVKSRATAFLGGIGDKSRPADAKNAPTLYIDGTVVMAGVEVKR